MGKPSIPQIRLGGSQYTIEPTADAEERIPYPYKELPIAMFKQMYRPLLGDQIPIHWHEGMQLLWVYDGTLSYRANGTEFPLDRNKLLFINHGILHSSRPVGTKVRTLCIDFGKELFPPALWQRFLEPFVENPHCTYELLPLDAAEVENLIGYINQTDDELILFSVTAFILTIMERVMKTFTGTGESRNTEETMLFDGLLSYIKEHFTESISLAQLSGVSHLNKNKLTELFQKYTGMPPILFLNTYRLDEARTRLLQSDRSVSEISEDIGYDQVSHFIQQFKKRYGLTPLQYRRAYGEKKEKKARNNLL